MPELPEVEVLVRHLAPRLRGRTIEEVVVRRPKAVRPGTRAGFARGLTGARFEDVSRRGKYLVFELARPGPETPRSRPAARHRPQSNPPVRSSSGRFRLLGHLGMTGRMYLQSHAAPLPEHAAVALRLDRRTFVYEDSRYFGRLTLALRTLDQLGPEPFDPAFTADYLWEALQRSRQAIKVKLLDQALVAGVGNIYASEALFRARLSPRRAARRVSLPELHRLRSAIRTVLSEAIACGSTVPLDWSGRDRKDALFYYGRKTEAPENYAERLRVYDRAGEPCGRCRTLIRRIVQGARSTYFCPRCQGGGPGQGS